LTSQNRVAIVFITYKERTTKMKLWQMIVVSAIIAVPLSNYYETKRQSWADWKREAWGIDE